MNGPEHFKRAQVLIERSKGEDLEYASLIVATAQVHATLALVAATVDAGTASRAQYKNQEGELVTYVDTPSLTAWEGVIA